MPAMRFSIGSLRSMRPNPVDANNTPGSSGLATMLWRSGLPPGMLNVHERPPSSVSTTPPTSTPTHQRSGFWRSITIVRARPGRGGLTGTHH